MGDPMNINGTLSLNNESVQVNGWLKQNLMLARKSC